jgi:hypothetical protein
MQALAAGYSGYAGASLLLFFGKSFKNLFNQHFRKGLYIRRGSV